MKPDAVCLDGQWDLSRSKHEHPGVLADFIKLLLNTSICIKYLQKLVLFPSEFKVTELFL